jgi:hypothetical protein
MKTIVLYKRHPHTENMTKRTQRAITTVLSLLVVGVAMLAATPQIYPQQGVIQAAVSAKGDAAQVLNTLIVKGRAAKTGYARAEFGNGWSTQKGCDTRNIILLRDLTNTSVDDSCRVLSGTLDDPYTATTIQFTRTEGDAVQIDHVIALSDAWQKGAQQLSKQQRIALANDPLELLAVDGPSNQQKGDGDAATWLPANKDFRCQYVARQIAVKQKYALWVTTAEKEAMISVLSKCPGQALPVE